MNDKQTLTEQLLAERDTGPIDRILVKAAKSDIGRGIDTRSSFSALQAGMTGHLGQLGQIGGLSQSALFGNPHSLFNQQ